MSPENQGRHCATCKKMVVDFAQMDDREIRHWLADHEGPVCGRFRSDQLNRPLLAPRQETIIRWRYWHYLLAGLLFSSEVSAQTKSAGDKTTHRVFPDRAHERIVGDTVMISTASRPSSFSSDTFRGRVTDDHGQGVPFATVLFEPHRGVAADAEGYFSINARAISNKNSLTISAVGFETVQVDVKKMRAENQVQLYPVVPIRSSILGEVIVATRHRKKAKPITDTLTSIKDTLACLGFIKNVFTIYPNPVTKGNSITLSARLDLPGTYQVQLLSLSGQLLQIMEVSGETGSQRISMNIPASLTPGAYFIRLFHPTMKKNYARQILIL